MSNEDASVNLGDLGVELGKEFETRSEEIETMELVGKGNEFLNTGGDQAMPEDRRSHRPESQETTCSESAPADAQMPSSSEAGCDETQNETVSGAGNLELSTKMKFTESLFKDTKSIVQSSAISGNETNHCNKVAIEAYEKLDASEEASSGQSKCMEPKGTEESGKVETENAQEERESKALKSIEDVDENSIEMVKEVIHSRMKFVQCEVGGEPEGGVLSETDRLKPKTDVEVVELSDTDEQGEDEDDDDGEEESSDDEVGDPEKPPGEGSVRELDPDHLMPFHHGWRREVVMRQKLKNSATVCDIYYIPPPDSQYRTREAKRKRRSKMDQEQYFEDFPHNFLSIQHFNYVSRPLGLGNAAYEIVRKPRGLTGCSQKKSEGSTSPRSKSKSYKEIEERGDLVLESSKESSDEVDEEVSMINGLCLVFPICLQAENNVPGLRMERKRRKKHRDPETCCTPPLAEDMLWSALDDDPLGVYTDLGGRSSPITPPPLRAVKLTPTATSEKIRERFLEVREVAKGFSLLKEPELNDNLASHDLQIRKFKHVKSTQYRAAISKRPHNQIYLPNRGDVQQQTKGQFKPQQHYGAKSTMIMGPVLERLRNSREISITNVQSSTSCNTRCPGAGRHPPNMRCSSCHCLFHAKCQGVSTNIRLFKCRNCVSQSSWKSNLENSSSESVRVKLPMWAVSGKRPAVELVMLQNGTYRPVKFSNNVTVTEVIPRRIFNQANHLRKTIYQTAKQVPHVGNKPIFLAIHPANSVTDDFRQDKVQESGDRRQKQPPQTEQVSILVRQVRTGQPNGTPVLLNVPRKVALKVKKGTTLSFSASDNEKYIVVDNKIHPPLKTSSTTSTNTRQQQSKHLEHQRTTSKQGVNPPITLSGSLSIQRTTRPPSMQRTLHRAMNVDHNQVGKTSKLVPGGNVLSSGEVVASANSVAMTPCTPYCPGVTGFPELECKECQSLFHGKCVGIPTSAISMLQGTWTCRMCFRIIDGPGSRRPPVQVIDLD